MTEVKASYAAAGFGGEVEFGKRPAVILIDIARAHIEPDAPLYVGSADAFQAMITLTEMARHADIPVIFTRVEFMPGGADGGIFQKKLER